MKQGFISFFQGNLTEFCEILLKTRKNMFTVGVRKIILFFFVFPFPNNFFLFKVKTSQNFSRASSAKVAKLE